MTKNTKTRSRLLLAGAALSATAMAAVPAHAGPLDFLKRAVKQELKETFEEVTESAVETAVETAVVATIGADPARTPEATPAVKPLDRASPLLDDANVEGGGLWNADTSAADGNGGGGIYNSGGTLDAQAQVGRGRTSARAQVGEAMTSQNGTTVATASEVQAPPSTSKGKVEATWKTEEGTKSQARPERGMSQNGTTVETASEVQAPADEQTALLLPAVQSAREAARSGRADKPRRGATNGGGLHITGSAARAKLSQNGTTVATANEVQSPAPQRD